MEVLMAMLNEFLQACIKEDKALALSADNGVKWGSNVPMETWRAEAIMYDFGAAGGASGTKVGKVIVWNGYGQSVMSSAQDYDGDVTYHVARRDPSHVLAE